MHSRDATTRRPHQATLAQAGLAAAAAIAGCTAGPDFEPPAPPEVVSYLAIPEPETTVAADLSTDIPAGAAQQFQRGRDIPAEWWALFESAALDAMVRQALDASPRLDQARARLVRAEQQLEARTGSTRYPQVSVSASGNRIGVESDAIESAALADEFPFTVSTASIGVSYTLDLFGRNRRELEALRAIVDYERFELEAVQLALAGSVVTAAIEEALLRQQIATIESVVALQERQLEIVVQLEQLGAASRLDVISLSSELATTRSTLPMLSGELEQTRHRLAIYLGQPPAAAELPELRFGTDLRLPTELPLSLPSDLARQRPDIRAAEALLHEASAAIGVASANYFPHITLSATAGGISIPPLLDGTAGFALLAASIAQPLFTGGAREAEQRAAEAAFDQAGAAYREVVLAALKNVADVLVALDADAKTLRERARAAQHARAAYEIASNQYEAGAISLLSLLDAERQLAATALDEILAIGDRYADTARLFQALGGGWWNSDAGAP